MIPHTQNQPDSNDSESPTFDRLADEMIMFTADEAHAELADDHTIGKRIFAAVLLAVMVTAAIVAAIVGLVMS